MAAVTVSLSLSTFDTWGQSQALNILVLIVLVGVVGISEAARLWAVRFFARDTSWFILCLAAGGR